MVTIHHHHHNNKAAPLYIVLGLIFMIITYKSCFMPKLWSFACSAFQYGGRRPNTIVFAAQLASRGDATQETAVSEFRCQNQPQLLQHVVNQPATHPSLKSQFGANRTHCSLDRLCSGIMTNCRYSQPWL